MSLFSLEAFWQQVQDASILEWIALFAGTMQVILAKKNNVLLYPFGIISTLAGCYLLYDAMLYAESLLNVYYFIMSIYGWYQWSRRDKPISRISRSTLKDYLIATAIVILSFTILYLALIHYTQSTTPVADAAVSAFAWAGTWLLTRRKLENWIFLNISNAIAIPLQLHKGLALYPILILILFIVAIFGYFSWKKEITSYEKSV